MLATWVKTLYKHKCGYIPERTGGHFACSCVHPLNDNSVGPSNSKTLIKFPYFPTKKALHDKNRTFSTRVFSCRFFSSRFSWPFFKTLKTQRQKIYSTGNEEWIEFDIAKITSDSALHNHLSFHKLTCRQNKCTPKKQTILSFFFTSKRYRNFS